MPDITMCHGVDAKGVRCPRRRECLRAVATPDPRWQSYFAPEAVDAGGGCVEFVDANSCETLGPTDGVGGVE